MIPATQQGRDEALDLVLDVTQSLAAWIYGLSVANPPAGDHYADLQCGVVLFAGAFAKAIEAEHGDAFGTMDDLQAAGRALIQAHAARGGVKVGVETQAEAARRRRDSKRQPEG